MRFRSAILILFTLALVVPTFALPVDHSDQIGDRVVVQSSSVYAYEKDSGIIIDISRTNPELEGEGVNDNAVTGISNVFVINYTGDQYAHVWLTHESEDVTFVARGHPIQSESNNITLSPDESVAVGLRVDTTGETTDGLIDDITIHAAVAEPEARSYTVESPLSVSSFQPGAFTRRFRITGADVGEAVSLDLQRLVVDRTPGGATLTLDGLDLTADDSRLGLTLSVANDSDRAFASRAGVEALGTVVVDMRTGDVRGATFEFSVARSYLDARGITADDLVVYRLSRDASEPQRIETRVVGEQDGRVRFVAESDGFSRFIVAARVPDIQVVDVRVDDWTITTGESATISVELENQGAVAGSRSIPVALRSEVVSEKNVTLGPGNQTTVTYTVSPPAGEYPVTVADTDVGTLVVEETATSSTTTVSPTSTTATQTSSTSTTAATTQTQTPKIQEPAAFDLDDIAGLIVFLSIILGTALLVRRAPWG